MQSQEIQTLQQRVRELLAAQPEGWSEYDLLQRVQEEGALVCNTEDADLRLFQCHFLLFHVLYRLRDEYWSSAEAHLDISPLNIQLLPYQQNDSGLARPDALHSYYGDLENLYSTTLSDVDEMLRSFWVRLHNSDHREAALAELGLSDPVDDDTIRTTYRRLVMAHHPDRGGSKSRLQELNAAMAMLAPKK